MRRSLIGLGAFLMLLAPAALATPASAAPPGPQCFGVLPCAGPLEKVEDKVQDIIETCQKAYCQFP